MKVFVDGGIRSGVDIFKALALGADAVMIARPFVTALYGGKDKGIEIYLKKLVSELEDTMKMCGATSLKDIFITFSDEIAELRAVGKSSPFWLMYQWQKKIKI